MLTELEEAGIRAIRTTAHDYKDACGGFFQAIMEKRLRYMPPQPELDTAVAGAITQPLLDAWKWSRKSGTVITPLVSCTLALWGARTQASPEILGLSETVARLRGETQEEPAQVQAPQSDGFIPLEEVPLNSRVF
jgi:hypothetical protein